MDTSSNTSSSLRDAEGQPFVQDQNPDDASSDSSEDHSPAHGSSASFQGSVDMSLDPFRADRILSPELSKLELFQF